MIGVMGWYPAENTGWKVFNKWYSIVLLKRKLKWIQASKLTQSFVVRFNDEWINKALNAQKIIAISFIASLSYEAIKSN